MAKLENKLKCDKIKGQLYSEEPENCSYMCVLGEMCVRY